MDILHPDSHLSAGGRRLGELLDQPDVHEELVEATGGEAGCGLVGNLVLGHIDTIAVAADAGPVTAGAWSEVVATCQALLAAAADLPDAIMDLAAADCWAEEDLSCRTAWADDPEDFDLEEPDPDEREGGRGPFWEDVWAADERRQAINRTLADQVLLWASSRGEAPGLEAARLALISEARTSVESIDGRQARFDLAYLAQEAAGRVRYERRAA